MSNGEQSGCVAVMECGSAREFYDYLLPTNPVWIDGFERPWLFRGQWDAGWSLSPKAWRTDGLGALSPLREAARQEVEQNWDRYLSDLQSLVGGTWPQARTVDVLIQLGAEAHAVYEFSLLADELGLHMPGGTSATRDSGMAAISGFTQGNMVAWNTSYLFAQHHGIPTRYLDVTRKSLIAAYFGTQRNGAEEAERIAVWAINTTLSGTTEWALSCLGTHVVTCPRSQHSFLHAQDGLFIGISGAEHFYLAQGRWPTLVDAVESHYTGSDSAIRQVTLPVSEVPTLLALLWHERISHAHLMPNYDNVTNTLLEKWAGFAVGGR